ncbi:sensor histidine kinase [Pseudoalteromonas spongiae]|uniref:sensor histidine kinase n=1 Tax=Pseudoalteromonas spongiae TaxID=298657 RepID=UPI003737105E
MTAKQLRNKIVTYFVSIVVLLSILFSLVTLMFSFVVEDTFFYQILNSEKQQVLSQIQSGQTPKPHFDFITYHKNQSTLPKLVQQALSKAPKQREFSGAKNTHYHIAYLDDNQRQQHILLAEVSQQLVVNRLTNKLFYFSFGLLCFGILLALVLALGTVKLSKTLLNPLDDLMTIVDNSPVEKLPTKFAAQFKQNEIGRFAQTLEAALVRVSAFVTREQQFTRDVSHELRTPLTVSQGAVTLLTHTELNQAQQKFVTRISDANQQMHEIIETLLALAREKHRDTEHTNLKSVIENCIIKNQALLKDVAIDISLADNANVAMGALELSLVVQNLLQNAIYHGQGSHIKIEFQDNVLTIADNGKGLTDTLSSQSVFEAGQRGPNSHGSGIGLSLVKRLCEKYGVDVSLNSDNGGVTITLTFT